MATNKVKTRIFYLCVVLLIGLFIYFARHSRSTLERNHIMTTGTIDEVRIAGRERFVDVMYHYFVNGKQRNDNFSFNQSTMSFENFSLLTGRRLPVAYNSNFFYTTSFILIFPDDYKDFNVQFPDSLNWILPLINRQ
jgi:hypothetical protein